MNATGTSEYLVNEVLTAPPQKLQLMLIEGALRFGLRAQQHWQAGQWEQAGEDLLRAQEIVGQMIAGATSEAPTPLARKVLGVYTFIYRNMVTAHLRQDAKLLAEALSVLEIERGTWQEVCRVLAPAAPPLAELDGAPQGGFSLQA